jgi:Mycolic acid cyclopropane synthetase
MEAEKMLDSFQLNSRVNLSTTGTFESVFTRAARSLRGQSDEKWIKSHYDIDADFFILWLDRRIRGYSHGLFEHDDEPLEDGMERKFRYAMKAANIKPGDRVLDIGRAFQFLLAWIGACTAQKGRAVVGRAPSSPSRTLRH